MNTAFPITASFICFFVAIYLGGVSFLVNDFNLKVQLTAWSTVFFIAGLAIVFLLLIYFTLGKTTLAKARVP